MIFCKRMKFWIINLLCVYALVRTCRGSAWLQDPPSRSAAWYYQIKTPVNYNFRNLNCGGSPVRIYPDGSRNCGLCGDAYSDPIPRPNELGGKYANPRVLTRYYESGQEADISIWNNLPGAPGFYEFRLCDEDWNQTQACLDKHLLVIKNTGTTNMPVPKTQGLVMIHLQLPVGVTCNKCLLQWRFRKEDIAGCDDNQWCGVGRGAQIEYYNCADVMIGVVGQPKPTYIQDPIYNAADYGSAYDVVTIRSTPDGSNIIGDTTTQVVTTTTSRTTTTTRVPILTIPTGFPTTTTTPSPATTTTSRPVTIGPVSTTQANNIGPQPTTERLVVDASGNAIAGQGVYGGVTNRENRRLILLLSLLPLIGAFGMQASKGSGFAPLAPVPQVIPTASVTWARTLPIYPIQFGDSYGFGNFQTAGVLASFGTNTYGNGGTYGSKKETYGAKYNSGNSVGTNGYFGSTALQGTIHTSNVVNTQYPKPVNYNDNGFNLNKGVSNNAIIFNSGGGQFVQNPVVWNTNGVGINNGVTTHVFPRSVGASNGASYQPSPAAYSNPAPNLPVPSTGHSYASNHNSGYQPHTSLSPQKPSITRNTVWQNQDNSNSWSSGGVNGNRQAQIWQGKGGRRDNAIWQSGGGSSGSGNSNAVGQDQRVPSSRPLAQPAATILPTPMSQDNSFNLPGIESAARFQTDGPRKRIGAAKPRKPDGATIRRNGGVTQNGGGSRLFSTLRQQNRRPMLVNDWYNMLLRRFPGEDSRTVSGENSRAL